jgi:hypothetical protein
LIKYQEEIKMGHGGVRPGGGRPKGASNKRTKETIAEAAASGVMPLEFMLAVMRDRNAPTADRFEAAKAAVPYVHGKLVASHTTEGDKKETLLQWIERQPPPLMIEDQSA